MSVFDPIYGHRALHKSEVSPFKWVRSVRTLRTQNAGTEMSGVQSVLEPKCPVNNFTDLTICQIANVIFINSRYGSSTNISRSQERHNGAVGSAPGFGLRLPRSRPGSDNCAEALSPHRVTAVDKLLTLNCIGRVYPFEPCTSQAARGPALKMR